VKDGLLIVIKGNNMSTSVVTNDATASSTDIAIKPENVEFKRFVKLDSEGKVDSSAKGSIAFSSGGKKLELLESNKDYTPAGTFTIRVYGIGTLDGLAELIGDNEEAVNIVNRGLTQKTNQKISEFLTSFDDVAQTFTNQESADVVDTREMLQEATQRRNLSMTDKAVKALTNAGYDQAKIMAILAQLQDSAS
jgi:hypothetical protein